MTRRRRLVLAAYRERVSATLDPELRGLAGIQRRLRAADPARLADRRGCRLTALACYLHPGGDACVTCLANAMRDGEG